MTLLYIDNLAEYISKISLRSVAPCLKLLKILNKSDIIKDKTADYVRTICRNIIIQKSCLDLDGSVEPIHTYKTIPPNTNIINSPMKRISAMKQIISSDD
jgi:hypothetical protein